MTEAIKKIDNSELKIPKQEKKVQLDVTLLQQEDQQRMLEQQNNSNISHEKRLVMHAQGGGAGLSQLSVEGMKHGRARSKETSALKLPVYLKHYKVHGLIKTARGLYRLYSSRAISSLHKKLRGRISARPHQVDMPTYGRLARKRRKKIYRLVFLVLGLILLAWYFL